jgi:class 3 adenylate cyclase
MPDPILVPTGTVKFLFTDIEGSTRLWQDEPEAMPAALVEHDALLRDAIAKRRGFMFKHIADGFAAAFASAADAVDAAVDGPSKLESLPLRMRMGLHTGEVQSRDDDYFGSTVNRCARLMAVAHGPGRPDFADLSGPCIGPGHLRWEMRARPTARAFLGLPGWMLR